VVSGVVALMLEANPELTWRDVQGIIATTSRMVTNDPEDSTRTTNGAGLQHSNYYGFGIVDAMAAVTAAESWILYGQELQLTASSNAVDLAIPDTASVVTTSVTLTEDGRFAPDNPFVTESVEVSLNLRHFTRGDLDITLTSPSGTKSILNPGKRPENSQLDVDERWQLVTVRNWNENPLGDWKLEITDVSGGDLSICVDRLWHVVVGNFRADCITFERLEWCKEGQINQPALGNNGYVVELTDDDEGINAGEACCSCGGGRTRADADFVDELVEWELNVYGHSLKPQQVTNTETLSPRPTSLQGNTTDTTPSPTTLSSNSTGQAPPPSTLTNGTTLAPTTLSSNSTGQTPAPSTLTNGTTLSPTILSSNSTDQTSAPSTMTNGTTPSPTTLSSNSTGQTPAPSALTNGTTLSPTTLSSSSTGQTPAPSTLTNGTTPSPTVLSSNSTGQTPAPSTLTNGTSSPSSSPSPTTSGNSNSTDPPQPSLPPNQSGNATASPTDIGNATASMSPSQGGAVTGSPEGKPTLSLRPTLSGITSASPTMTKGVSTPSSRPTTKTPTKTPNNGSSSSSASPTTAGIPKPSLRPIVASPRPSSRGPSVSQSPTITILSDTPQPSKPKNPTPLKTWTRAPNTPPVIQRQPIPAPRWYVPNPRPPPVSIGQPRRGRGGNGSRTRNSGFAPEEQRLGQQRRQQQRRQARRDAFRRAVRLRRG
jgi:subtilisin-like proprotein convertase family protein